MAISRRSPPLEKHGWTVDEFLLVTSFGRTNFYELPEKIHPKFVRNGKRKIIVEPPAQWFERLAKWQAGKEGA